MNAAEIAKLPFFIEACRELGVKPTKRQARKAKQGAGRWREKPQLSACLRNIQPEPEPVKEAA